MLTIRNVIHATFACLMPGIVITTSPVAAQGVFYAAPVRTLSSSFSSPYGIAVDGAGNVFVSDIGSHSVLEMKASNGAVSTNAVPVTVPGAFYGPEGMILSSSGLAVTDYGATCLYIISLLSHPTPQQCIGSGLSSPSSVATDSAGNFYVADYVNNAIKEIPYGADVNTVPTVLIKGISLPNSVAVDAAGDLFYTQVLGTTITEVLAVNGTIPLNAKTRALGTNLYRPHGLSFTPQGDLLVSDDGIIKVLTAASDLTATLILANRVNVPIGTAADSQGNVYYVDSGNHLINEIVTTPQDFGSVQIGSTSQPVTLTFTFTQTVSINGASIVSHSPAGFAFTDTNQGTCDKTHVFNTGDSCTVLVTFKPTRWGMASATVQLLDSGNNVLAVGNVKGAGGGVQTNFPVNTICCALGFAADSHGNVFISDSAGGGSGQFAIRELLSGTATIRTLFTTKDFPQALAIDPTGNIVYQVSDWPTQKTIIKEYLAPSYTQTRTYVSDVYNPFSIAFDHSGNLFFSTSLGISQVREVLASGGVLPSTLHSVVVGTGFSSARGLALDSGGNLVVGDRGDGTIKQLSAASGYTSTRTLASGLPNPSFVSFDGAGNLYVASDNAKYVMEFLVSGNYSTIIGIQLDQYAPMAAVADFNGNVFLAFNPGNAHNFEELKDVGSSTSH